LPGIGAQLGGSQRRILAAKIIGHTPPIGRER
jgi:hypothetical protein